MNGINKYLAARGGWINMKRNVNKNNIIIQRHYIW